MTNDMMLAMQQALVTAGIPNVYIGDLPELQMDCVALRNVDGYPSTIYFGKYETFEPLVEVIIRAKEYLEGARMSDIVLNTFKRFEDTATGISQATVVGSPGYLGRNVEGFGEWHCIIHVTLTDNN